jgi:hypothetical protein
MSKPASPSWASCPFSASGAADSVFAGVPDPPPSVLSVSHALDGLHPATPFRACLIPVTLLGFGLQGLDPSRGAATTLAVACSLAVRHVRSCSPQNLTLLQSLTLPRSPNIATPKRSRCPIPSWPLPPLRFSALRWYGRLPDPSSHALARIRELRSLVQPKNWHFLFRGADPFGVFHLVSTGALTREPGCHGLTTLGP